MTSSTTGSCRDSEYISGALADAGYPEHRFLDLGRLVPGSLESVGPGPESTGLGPLGTEDADRRERPELYGDLPAEGTLVIAAHPYRAEPAADAAVPSVSIGAFARANRYADMASRLKKARNLIAEREGISAKRIRVFCNSRLPEKELARLAGLGFIGRNTLLVTRRYGSSCVLGGLILPFRVSGDHGPRPMASLCGTCRACVEACPQSALSGILGDSPRKALNRETCTQARASELRAVSPVVMERWGDVLYGCDRCQAACPWNRDSRDSIPTELGALPASIPLSEILPLGPEGIETLRKGTCLDMKWIDPRALFRNCLIAAGNSGDHGLAVHVRSRLGSSCPEVAEAARWALGKIESR